MDNNLSPQDRRHVQRELAALPARINAAKESEMGEMMGKLKEVTGSLHTPPSNIFLIVMGTCVSTGGSILLTD